jgi:hypothetical protein
MGRRSLDGDILEMFFAGAKQGTPAKTQGPLRACRERGVVDSPKFVAVLFPRDPADKKPHKPIAV